MIQSPLRGHSENRKLDADAKSVKAKFIFFAQSLGRVRIGKPTFSRTCTLSFLFVASRCDIKYNLQIPSPSTAALFQLEGIDHL